MIGMLQRGDWQELRDRRIAEPGATEAYDVTRLAYQLGRRVRELREQLGLSQTTLAKRASMTQPAVARRLIHKSNLMTVTTPSPSDVSVTL